MGTNYYVPLDPCKHCGRADEKIHLGKSSYGWKFHFRGYRDTYQPDIKSVNDWKDFLAGKQIFDEYGKEISHTDFWQFVEGKQQGRSNLEDPLRPNPYSTGPRVWYDDEGYWFCDYEFC